MTPAERETPQAKSARLLKMAAEAIESISRDKIGKQHAYGESSVTIIWKGGCVDSIRIMDDASVR